MLVPCMLDNVLGAQTNLAFLACDNLGSGGYVTSQYLDYMERELCKGLIFISSSVLNDLVVVLTASPVFHN